MDALVEPSGYVLNAFALPALLFGVLVAGLGIVTCWRERGSGVSVAFCGMTLIVALWLMGVVGMYSSGDGSLALRWARIAHLGVCFIPVTVFLFAATVTGRVKASRWMIRAGFFAAAFIYVLDASTTWIIADMQHFYFGYYAIFSLKASPLLFAYFALYLGGSLHVLRGAYLATQSAAQRGRLKALFIAIAISEFATVDFLADFHVPVYPFGYIFIGAFVVIGTWVIARYRLVDITPALAAREIIGVMANGLLVVDRDGVVRVANPAAEATWGLSGGLVGLALEALDAAWSQPALTRLIDPDSESQTEVVFRANDGSPRTVQLSSSKLHDHRGVWVGTVFIVRDITERWQAERAVRDSEERFRSLVQHAADLVTVIDPDTTVRYQSPSILRVLGVDPEATVGTRLDEALHRDDRASFMAALAELIAKPGSAVAGEGRVRHVNGEWRHLEFTGSDQRSNPAIGGIVLNVRDVTERKRLEDELRMQARQDPITGLANRYSFTDHLERALARYTRTATGVAVLFLDLDDFKGINDRLGHAAGDRLLHEVGRRLVTAVRAADVVARLGGDEFAVVLENVASADEAAGTAARILELLEEPVCIDGSEVPVSASIGIALPAPGEATAGRLLRNADIAMYAAKSSGRGRFEIYDARPSGATRRRIHVVGDDSRMDGVADEAEWSRRDALTEAWNHAAIVELVQREISSDPAASVSVAVVDVDGMTEINDTYGHDSGDRALRAVAQALARNRAVVGRYGGDRFLVLLPGTHHVGAQAYAADVTRVVADLRLQDGETLSTIPVSISVGVATYPVEAATMDGVIRLAEGALYVTKSRRAMKQGEATRRLADRVANLTDELIPLLTSPAPLDDKIRLVAERLSDGLGYDGAECTLYSASEQELAASCALVDGAATPLAQSWADAQAMDPARHQTALRVLLARIQRPILIEDLVNDERISERKRRLMQEMGLQAALVVPMMSNGELIGELGLARRKRGAFGPEDARFLSAVANQVAAMVRMATLVDGLRQASERVESAQAETVFMLAAAAEAHDRTTGEHLRHLAVLSEALARELGYEEAAVRGLGLAATLHDIGKISVPDSVLASPLRFDSDDLEITKMWETMKRHSIWGADFLKDREGFELAADVARWHHERWDGGGYPDGLTGDQLPEAVTIVTVADAFDAMVSDRPYRIGRSPSAAVQEIVACSGKQFNPRVVDALVRLHEAGRLQVEPHEHDRAA